METRAYLSDQLYAANAACCIQLFQKTSDEKQKVFKPRPQGNECGLFQIRLLLANNHSTKLVADLYPLFILNHLIILVLKKHKVKLRFSRSALLLIPIFESNFVQLISKEK